MILSSSQVATLTAFLVFLGGMLGYNVTPVTSPTTTTTTTTSTTTTTTVPAPTTTIAPHTNYLFDDEFNGTAVDTNLWTANWLGAPGAITKSINGAEASCYDPKQVTVSGGYLHLTAVQRACQSWAWASGIVTSHGKFNFTNGTIEARIFTPGTTSMSDWPAFWTDGNGSWPSIGENDIMEGLSGKACWHYHSPSGGPGGCVGSLTGWHVYKAVVAGGTSTYYYDGAKVGQLATVNAPHYIIVNLGVGGYGNSVKSAAEMLVDYVRVSGP